MNRLLLPPHFSSIHQDQSGEEIKNVSVVFYYFGLQLKNKMRYMDIYTHNSRKL